jgi:V/A-type H+-transporting ATPase subunit I
MIVVMSKVEITLPRELALPVLETIQEAAVLQIAADIQKRIRDGAVGQLRPVAFDSQAIAERLFLEDLHAKVGRLLSLLPQLPVKDSHLSSPEAVSSIAAIVGQHLEACEQCARRREALQSELRQLDRYMLFLATIESLAPKGPEAAGLEFVGVEVKDPAALEQLTKVAGRMLLGAEVRTARAADGSYIGLLTTEREFADKLKESLRGNQVPEIRLPAYLEGLSLPDKTKAASARHVALSSEMATIDKELADLSRQWRAHYQSVQLWLEQRLSLLKTSAELYETDRCFVLFGWMPSAAVDGLRKMLAARHGAAIVVEEKELLEADLDEVPVTLKNRGYFRPFELLVRLLPLPRYSSIDPTPFIGIFFPLFFGMILGDAGYGLVLLAAAFAVILFSRRESTLRQAGQILLVASVYAIVFGLVYGECFGEAGARWLGLPAPRIDRRTSIMPMLYFTLAVGAVHVAVGLVLGFVTALRGRRTKEAVFRVLSLLIIVCIAGLLASYLAPVTALLRRPLMVALLVIGPVLLLTGGILAPFELLRDLGNIISYVRIMAVGLASVLLAYVANQLAGAAGSVWVGVTVAILLHAFNLVLGVFAPAIHALRLHYVEFFTKFVESGGRHFEPLRKGDGGASP